MLVLFSHYRLTSDPSIVYQYAHLAEVTSLVPRLLFTLTSDVSDMMSQPILRTHFVLFARCQLDTLKTRSCIKLEAKMSCLWLDELKLYRRVRTVARNISKWFRILNLTFRLPQHASSEVTVRYKTWQDLKRLQLKRGIGNKIDNNELKKLH